MGSTISGSMTRDGVQYSYEVRVRSAHVHLREIASRIRPKDSDLLSVAALLAAHEDLSRMLEHIAGTLPFVSTTHAATPVETAQSFYVATTTLPDQLADLLAQELRPADMQWILERAKRYRMRLGASSYS